MRKTALIVSTVLGLTTAPAHADFRSVAVLVPVQNLGSVWSETPAVSRAKSLTSLTDRTGPLRILDQSRGERIGSLQEWILSVEAPGVQMSERHVSAASANSGKRTLLVFTCEEDGAGHLSADTLHLRVPYAEGDMTVIPVLPDDEDLRAIRSASSGDAKGAIDLRRKYGTGEVVWVVDGDEGSTVWWLDRGHIRNALFHIVDDAEKALRVWKQKYVDAPHELQPSFDLYEASFSTEFGTLGVNEFASQDGKIATDVVISLSPDAIVPDVLKAVQPACAQWPVATLQSKVIAMQGTGCKKGWLHGFEITTEPAHSDPPHPDQGL